MGEEEKKAAAQQPTGGAPTTAPGSDGAQSKGVAMGDTQTSAGTAKGAQTTSTATQSTTTTNNAQSPSTMISTTLPDDLKVSSYDDVISLFKKRLSGEELEKIRRRQKAEGIISGISDAVSSVANLIFTHHYAPNMYDGNDGMSAKARARFEKEKADYEAEADKQLNYALNIARLRDADRQGRLETWKTEQSLLRQDRAYEDGRKDRTGDVEYRDKVFGRQGEWHEEDKKREQERFDEGVRQFNINSENDRKRLGLEGQRLAKAMQDGRVTFSLGSGNGNVTIPTERLNAQTVSRIFSTLPEEVRKGVQGEPIAQSGFIVGYKPPTTEAMLIAIGANIEGSPETQRAIRELAGSQRRNDVIMPGVK